MSEQRKTLLVVEDEESLLSTLREEFEEAGFEVLPVTSGEEALRKAQERMPDGILLDIFLAGELDGLGALRQLKQDERTRAIPVIMLSNVGDEEHVREALDLGAEAYFVKTRYSPQDLVEHLQKIIDRPRA